MTCFAIRNARAARRIAPLALVLIGAVVPARSALAEPMSLVQINGHCSLDCGSTFTNGSFRIENTGDQPIEHVTFDLSAVVLPDIVMDPDGTAGDIGGKDFTPDVDTGVGLGAVAFSDAYQGGYRRLDVDFSSFDPGDVFAFSVDTDPTTINGAAPPGPEMTGDIGGVELVGTKVTITYGDGSALEAETFRAPSSVSTSQNIVRSGLLPRPGIEVLGVSPPATVGDTMQTVRVTGEAGRFVRLMILEGGLFLEGVPGGGNDVDPFEANKALSLAEESGVIGAGGFIDFDVELLRTTEQGGINHLVAVLRSSDGATSPTSDVLVLEAGVAPNIVCINSAMDPTASFQGNMTTGTQFANGADNDPDEDSLLSELIFADSTTDDFSGDSGDRVSYTVTLPFEAQWRLWARFYYSDPVLGQGNSFYARVDGGTSEILGNTGLAEYFEEWHWDGATDGVQPLELGILSAGSHTLEIIKREVGGSPPRIDAICLTTHPTEPPTDLEASLALGSACNLDADCDDGNPCTDDSCTGNVCFHDPAGASCDDGLFCNGTDFCVNGACTGHEGDVCDDGIGCTVDSCDEGANACDNAPDDGACDDGVFCNGTEICDDILDCEPGPTVACDDGIDCTVDSCDEGANACDNAPDDAACDDGTFCNGVEVCDAALDCQEGTPIDCDDGVGCTVDSCDDGADACDHAPDDGACGDGVFCNGAEVCDPELDCRPGPSVACDDGIDCTADSCDEAADTCMNVADDGACDDGAFCNGAETCDPQTGCEPGTEMACDDGVDCTVDSCDEANDSCSASPSDARCDDGAFCNGTETCDAENDCQAGEPVDCDDGIDCTDDACDESDDACTNAGNDGLCSDGTFCNGAERCDPSSGCEPGTPRNCSDGISCTNDSCNEGADRCDHAPNDGACDDGAYCNGPERCDTSAGCEPGPPPCDDGVACTVDGCDEPTRTCSHSPSDPQCDDGSFCSGTESCDPELGCRGGTPADCSAFDSFCGSAQCDDELEDCTIEPQHQGETCDDGDACSFDDVCLGGFCFGLSLCGLPASQGGEPNVLDALFVLQAAVGLRQCEPCQCDVTGNGVISASDVLPVLQRAIGLDAEFNCAPADLALGLDAPSDEGSEPADGRGTTTTTTLP